MLTILLVLTSVITLFLALNLAMPKLFDAGPLATAKVINQKFALAIALTVIGLTIFIIAGTV